MKIPSPLLPILLPILLLLLSPAKATADLLTAVKLGHMNTHVPAVTEPDNLTLGLGYEFDTLIAYLSMEGELSRSFDNGISVGGENLEAESNAVYLVGRTIGTLYLTVRAGYIDESITNGNATIDAQGSSFGWGLGVIVGKTRWSIEVTRGENTEFIGLGVEFY